MHSAQDEHRQLCRPWARDPRRHAKPIWACENAATASLRSSRSLSYCRRRFPFGPTYPMGLRSAPKNLVSGRRANRTGIGVMSVEILTHGLADQRGRTNFLSGSTGKHPVSKLGRGAHAPSPLTAFTGTMLHLLNLSHLAFLHCNSVIHIFTSISIWQFVGQICRMT